MYFYLDKDYLKGHRLHCLSMSDVVDSELAEKYFEYEAQALPKYPYFEDGILREATRLENIVIGRELPGYMEYLLNGELHKKPEMPAGMVKPYWDMETLAWVETATEEEIQAHKEALEKQKEYEELPGTVTDLDDRLYMTQEMVDSIIFGIMSAKMLTKEEKELNTQAIYYYDRIIQKEKREGLQAAKNYYNIVVSKFPQYKDDIDFLLIDNDKEYIKG